VKGKVYSYKEIELLSMMIKRMIEKEEEDYICINGWGCGLENISLEKIM
jgi:hypothetical protein